MMSIEYYDPRVKGYVITQNLNTEHVWEIFKTLTGLETGELNAAQKLYRECGHKLVYSDEVYGYITIKDEGLNS